MTIAPVAAPSAPPAPGSPSSGGGAAGEFDALVRQHLARDSEDPDQSTSEATAAILEAASAPTAVRSDSLAALLAGMLAPVPAAAAGAGTTDLAGVDPEAPTAATTGATTGAPTAALIAGAPTVPTGATTTATTTGAPTLPAPGIGLATGPAATGAGLPGTSPVGGRSVLPGTSVVGGRSVTVDSAAPVAGPEAATPRPGTQPMPGTGEPGTSPATAGVAGVDLTGSAAGTAGVPSADAAGGNAAVAGMQGTVPGSAAAGSGGDLGATVGDPVRGNPITDQVFGQVTRLVSRGDGLHRLTLRLHPADLGEVKVVMTVKDGVVDVTLSAGAAAREALRDGSPQLRSLLELAGATTGQLVVRELASTGSLASAANPQTGNPPGQHPGQAGPGNEQEGSFAPGTAGDGTDSRHGSSGSDGGGSAGTRPGPLGAARSVSGPDATGRRHAAGPNPLSPPRLDLDL